MKKIIPVLILISTFLYGCNHIDSPLIVGEWKLVSLTIRGNPWSHPEGKELITTFGADHTFEMKVGTELKSKGTYTLEDSNLDMDFDSINNSPQTTVRYIMELDGHMLTLCNLENGVRPTSFDTTTNSILQVLEKIK
jgi:uncharacterized protein (TIGR03067 family)